jgi:hypothetical protein
MNNLAVLDGRDDRHHAARNGFKRALFIELACENAQRKLAMLESCGCGEQDDCDVNPVKG